MAIETGIYGEVTIRHELAHGIYQLILAAGNQLRALIIGKEFAKQVLSQSALSMADDYDENHLGYPEQDGRMSIPMLELNQKGLINIPLQEAKEHFNNLVHLVPEYLRRRGILKEKSLPDMQTKLADEARQLEKSLQSKSKKDIIAAADKITEFNKIKGLLASDELPLRNQGLLIADPKLIDNVRKTLHDLNCEITAENVQKICGSYDELYPGATADELEDIRSELSRTRETKIKTLIMQINVNGEAKDFMLSAEDFEKQLLTDEIKAEFAKKYMLDFPSADYYGDANRGLFEALFLKRFGENIQENWEQLAPQGENTQLHIKALSTEVPAPNSFNELCNISHIKGYLKAAYEQPEKYVERLLKHNELEEHKKTLDEIKQLIDNVEKGKNISEETSEASEPETQALDERADGQADDAAKEKNTLTMMPFILLMDLQFQCTKSRRSISS